MTCAKSKFDICIMACLRFRRKNTHGMTGGKLKIGQKNIKTMNCCGSPPPNKKQFSLQVCVCFRPLFNCENDHRQKYVCVCVNIHLLCTHLASHFYRWFDGPHKHTHTHGLHTNTHILLPIVVFANKIQPKKHTHT